MMTKKDTLVYIAGVLLFMTALIAGQVLAVPPQVPEGFVLEQEYAQLWGYELPGCQSTAQAIETLRAVCETNGLLNANFAVQQDDLGMYCGSIKAAGGNAPLLFTPYATGFGASYWADLSMDAAARKWVLTQLAAGRDYRVEYEDDTTCIISYRQGGRMWQAAIRSQAGGVRYTIATPAVDGDF